MSKSEQSKGEIIDVRIVEVGLIPPTYLFRPPVLEAIRREVRADVVERGKSLPAGVAPIYDTDAHKRVVTNGSLRHPELIPMSWPVVVLLILIAIGVGIFITLIVGGA